MTELADLKQKLTPNGRQILEKTVERKGEKWVKENQEMVLAQAELVGMTNPEAERETEDND
jgi:hypothetical protein